MRRIHYLFLLFALLAGCANSNTEEMVSNTVYGTVKEIGDQSFIIQRDDNKKEFSVPFTSDVMLLDNDICTSLSDIHLNDQLMCTYTNGQLTVIEIIHSDNPPTD